MNNKIFSSSILVFIFFLSHLVWSQKLSITEEKFLEHKKAGDNYYTEEEWYLASQEYLKAAKLKPNDPHVNYLLAESYRKNLDYDDAEIWYKKTVTIPNNGYPYSLLFLGLMQKTNGKYIEAEDTIEEFIKHFKPKSTEDKLRLKEAEFEYKGCLFALEQLKKPAKEVNFELLPPPINSKNQDYAPMLFFHDSSIVFTSSRKDAKGHEKNLATGEARSDNFRFHKVNGKWEKVANDDNFDIVNTPKDDGAGELSKDKSKYYYTSCDRECEIFVSKKIDGKFSKPIKLNKHINASGYWNAQPTLSPTADTMYFVSKRSGGKGGNDIWMSVNKDLSGQKEDWGPAINVASINTEYDEVAPFWDDHTNTIYFSSNGHVGFGAFDIYVALGSKRDSIVNIGLPFNSSRDDFYFNLGVNKGYLVSDRKNGIGETDIYWFDTHAKESVVGEMSKAQFADAESVTSTGKIVLSDTQQPMGGVSVYLKDSSGTVIKETKTNSNGEFLFADLPAKNNYKITISESDPRVVTKMEYVSTPKANTALAANNTSPITTPPTSTNTPKNSSGITSPNSTTEKPVANSENKASTSGNQSSGNPKSPVSEPKPTVENPTTKPESPAPSQNSNAAPTSASTASAESQAKAAPVKEANMNANSGTSPSTAQKPEDQVESPLDAVAFESAVEAKRPAAKPKKQPVAKSSVKAEKSAFTIESFTVSKSSKKPSKALFENVYFEFNESALTGAAKIAMDELVLYYGNNKGIQIEIKAYSDGYGDPEYNKQMAEQRGQACYDYLIGKGVESTALLIIPIGAGNFIGANNSFIGRQLNRRVEFSIIGAKEPYKPTAMAYIVEPRMTLFSTAKRYGMTVNELKAMNAINTEDIKAYSTLRVKRSTTDDIIAKETLESLKSGIQEYKFENMQFIPVGTASMASATDNSTDTDAIHTVQPQETLFSIAKSFGLSVDQLMQLNNLTDNNIRVGQKLKVK